MRVGVVAHGGQRFRVHALALDAPEVAELLAFRDRLRAKPAFRSAYEAYKRGILAGGGDGLRGLCGGIKPNRTHLRPGKSRDGR